MRRPRRQNATLERSRDQRRRLNRRLTAFQGANRHHRGNRNVNPAIRFRSPRQSPSFEGPGFTAGLLQILELRPDIRHEPSAKSLPHLSRSGLLFLASTPVAPVARESVEWAVVMMLAAQSYEAREVIEVIIA